MRREDGGAAARSRRSLLKTLIIALGATLAAVVTLALVLPPEPAPPPEPGGANRGVGLLTERPPPTRQEPLPDFTLDAFAGGEKVRAADYAGSPLVLNFWATWCAPCVEEMPVLQQASEDAGSAVAYLGVNLLDQHDKAVALVDSLGITYDLAIDPQGRLADEVGLFGMPTTLFVDADGMIRYRHTGPLTSEQITQFTDAYLGVGG